MKTTLITLMLLLTFSLFGQETEKSKSFKNNQYSIAFKNTTNIIATHFFEGLEANIFHNSYIYSAGYYFGNDNESGYTSGPRPREEYNQINLLFGKYNGNNKWRFQYQAGLGWIWGTLRTDVRDISSNQYYFDTYLTKGFYAVGVPLKIGGRFIPIKFMSLGIDVQANLNIISPTIRPMLSLEVGRLRGE
jgi:hypothetical protein